MKKWLLLSLVLFSFMMQSVGQDKSIYLKKKFVSGNDSLLYRILLPEKYDTSKAYPLILFLHGMGERGNDNEAQLVHGWKVFLRDSVRKKYPAIVIFPQCPLNSFWTNLSWKIDETTKQRVFNTNESDEPTLAMKLLLGLVDDLGKRYKLDTKRYYVGGLSMGGMGTFELVRRQPNLFAAAFPICGGADPDSAPKLKETAWWMFHGQQDWILPADLSQNIHNALLRQGAKSRLTLYPGVEHNSWDPAFAEKELIGWLFSNHK